MCENYVQVGGIGDTVSSVWCLVETLNCVLDVQEYWVAQKPVIVNVMSGEILAEALNK